MAVISGTVNRAWVFEKLFMGQSLSEYSRSLLTPFNMVAALILAVGVPVSAFRYWQGLGAVTNLSDARPWGLWIGFDVLVGVALAAGGYTMATAVHVFRLDDYRGLVRPAVLTGFLGYFFVAVAILFDLGQPWRLPYPLFSMGVTSVMFLVAWHVFLYLTTQFVEFSPAVFEWLGARTFRRWAVRLALGATIFGVMLSTLHQSALGALFLLAPHRVHPLWYSPLIPLYFLISSVIAGLSMVIFESMVSHRVFAKLVSAEHGPSLDRLTIGLGKAASVILFTYFGLKIVGVMNDDRWQYLATPYGVLFAVEMLGFVLLPSLLFMWSAKRNNVTMVRATAVMALLGVVLNRLNVSVITFNWDNPDRYFPAWTEFVVTVTLVTLLVLVFRWIVNRMPVLHDHPDYPIAH